jgi:hypothetical protein
MRTTRVGLVALLVLGVLAIPATASARVKIYLIQYDPSGPDDGSRASLNDEFICLENTGNRSVDLTGWTIRDQDGNVYTFESYSLPSKAIVTIHTGRGSDRRLHTYWDQTDYVWDNPGETARLRRANGNLVDACRYRHDGGSLLC